MPMVVTPQQLQLSTPINPSNYTTPESVLELVRSSGDALQNEIPSAQYDAADAGSVAETLRFIERLMSSHIKPPSSDGPSASTAPGSSAAPKDANNTSTITDDAYDIFEFSIIRHTPRIHPCPNSKSRICTRLSALNPTRRRTR
jgi:hypothetical protein